MFSIEESFLKNGIYSTQGFTAYTRHGVQKKEENKVGKHIRKLI